MEKYLLGVSKNISGKILKFRTRNICLPVCKFNDTTDRVDVCTLCNDGIGDEFHYVLVCKKLKYERKQFLPGNLVPNVLTFERILSNYDLVIELSRFVNSLMRKLD